MVTLLRNIYHYFLIKHSGLFDEAYYLFTNPEVQKAGINPLWHFVKTGWKKGKSPSETFNVNSYLNLNPDVENENINPLIHYIKYGRFENRQLLPSNLDDLKYTFDNQSFEELHTISIFNPPKTIDIIIFPIIDWTFRFQRPQHLALQLAKQGYRIFYIKTGFCRGAQPRIKKLRHNLYSIQLSNGNLKTRFNTVLSEKDFPNLLSSINIIKDIFLIASAAMIVDLPFWSKLVQQLKTKYGWKIIYDCMDFHLGFSIHSHQAPTDEKSLIQNSDLVVATSDYLLNHVSGFSRNSVLIPNGTDYDFFHKARSPIPCDEIERFPKPIIGYYGAIADWFDTHLIGELAADNHNWSFVLIGNKSLADTAPLLKHQNIYLLGEKPYNEIPKYLSHFNVCLIPFKHSTLTDATNPVKMYEYFSAGKPIVATKLDELTNYSDYVYLAESKQEWEDAINQCLTEEKTSALLNKRFQFAENNTWKKRSQKFQSEILRLYKKISIIIISYNNQPLLELCLNSIIENTEYPNYEIIIVDNKSDQSTVNYLKKFHLNNDNSKIILNDENFGFAKANNQGFGQSEGEFLIFLNNDTIVTPGWIHRLMLHLEKNPGAGMVGPVTNSIGNEAKIEVDYTSIDEINEFSAQLAINNFGKSFMIQVLALYCCMISRKLFQDVGGLDERYEIGMFEDDDLAMKIKQKSLHLICAEDVFIHHFHGASFKKMETKEYQRIFNENKKRFEEKWGIVWTPHKYR